MIFQPPIGLIGLMAATGSSFWPDADTWRLTWLLGGAPALLCGVLVRAAKLTRGRKGSIITALIGAFCGLILGVVMSVATRGIDLLGLFSGCGAFSALVLSVFLPSEKRKDA